MYPFSYTGLKVIHEQQIQEALEQQHLYPEYATQRHALPLMFGKFLAHFTNRSGRKYEEALSGCSRTAECTAS